eukprot:5138393-Heterocapsa_arctica.AAC.1
MAAGRKQTKFAVPINSFAKSEGVFACSVIGCAYFAKTETELTRHLQCQHPPAVPAPSAPRLPAESAAAAPPVSLLGAKPIVAARAKRKR